MKTNQMKRQRNALNRKEARVTWLFLVALFTLATCRADTVTWNGSVDNDWFKDANWSPAHVPAAGDAVVVNASAAPATNLVLSSDTAALASLTITDSILVFTNWATTLNATNVTIGLGGVFTLPPAFTNNVMSNRVHVVCSALSILPGGVIDADEKGFGPNTGKGTGTVASSHGAGAGHGGVGGRGSGTSGGLAGIAYDSPEAPVGPGSGAATSAAAEHGVSGGGAVRIEASGGTVKINGTISANGGDGQEAGGGGSGGSIYITCMSLIDSANGLLQANGGNSINEGGGGGGRIAVHYDNLSNCAGIRFSTSPGIGYFKWVTDWALAAGMGTVYLSDTTLLAETLTDHLFTGVKLTIPGFTSWSVNTLTVSNCSVEMAQSGFQLTVANNLTIGTNGVLGLGSESGTALVNLACDSLSLSQGGALHLYSGSTNGLIDYGALIAVANDIVIGSGSWIYPYSHSSNGGSPLFRMQNLTVAANGGFNALGRGYATSKGPGRGDSPQARSAGGGYGGIGGAGIFSAGGIMYGTINAPTAPGSGAGTYFEASGRGGGVVRIEANGNITVNGTLTATGSGSNRGGGGAGGSIFLQCNELSGSGTLNADGGKQASPDHHGDGGGGRIALVVTSDRLSGEAAGAYEGYAGSANGRVSVKAGTGGKNLPIATNGSFYLKKTQGTLIRIR